jgi:hypothetical protein
MGRNGPSQKGADIMNVRIVSANIRYSAEAKGAWRTIELGAEAAVAPNEDWHIAQEQLYHRLGQQMKKACGTTAVAQERPSVALRATYSPLLLHLAFFHPASGALLPHTPDIIQAVREERTDLVQPPARKRLVKEN